MPDVTMKRCPQCGQRTANLELAQCPYCRVALVTETGVPSAGLTREQVQMLARQILGSWKLWAALVVLVAAAAWGVTQVSQRIIDARSKEYLQALGAEATNRIAAASAEISKQVSNQIHSELRQPRMQAEMEQMAKDRVNDAMSNALLPSLEEFERSLFKASSQLSRSTNDLAKLDQDIKAAEHKMALAQVTTPAPPAATHAAAPASAVTPATSNAPAPSTPGTSKLTMSTQSLMQNGQDYVVTVFFKQTSSTPIGQVTLEAATLVTSGAKIINFGLVTPGKSQPVVMNDAQTAAQLAFNVNGGDVPAVAVEVTGPTIVQVSGDALASTLMLPVAPEKLSLPSTAR